MRIEALRCSCARRSLLIVRARIQFPRCSLVATAIGLWMCSGIFADDTLAEYGPTAESPSALGPTAESPIALADLPLLWQAQRAEIATAAIRFRCFNSTFENLQNTPEHVAQLLTEHDLIAQPDELNPFLEALTGLKFDQRKPWDDMVLTVSGNRRRLDGGFCKFVTDGDLEAVYTPANRQLDLQPVGKSTIHHYRLDDLRWIPPQRVSPGAWQYLHTVDGSVLFNVPPAADGPDFAVLTSLDSASGNVTHSITRHADGSPAIEMYQSGLDLHAAGILFPRLRVDLTYANGAVYTARVLLVLESRFNEPVADESFTLPVAAGTRIVEYRTAEKDVWIAPSDIPDALSLTPRVTAPASRPVVRAGSSAVAKNWWWLLASVHLAGLTAAVLLIWRRRRSVSLPSQSPLG